MNRLKRIARGMEKNTSNSDEFQQEMGEKDILQLNRLYATFSRIYQVIVTVHERDEIFRKICKIAVEYGKLQMAWFGLVDDTGLFVRPVTLARKEQENLKNKDINLSDEALSICPTVKAIREGRCVFCKDISTDPRIASGRAEARKRGFSSSVTVPIRENSVVVGAFTAYSFDPMIFDALELQLFDDIGLAISFALEMIETEKQRKLVLEELEKSEERFREMFDNAPMAYHELDDKGHIVKINNTELAMLGYNADEVIGQYSW
jgi:GAF domain-containing protein